jgi:hypothetical protein
VLVEGAAGVPSPKSHSQLDAGPIEVSAKLTVRGAAPVAGVAVKLATGAINGNKRPAICHRSDKTLKLGPTTDIALKPKGLPVTVPMDTPSPSQPGGAGMVGFRKTEIGPASAAVKMRGVRPTSDLKVNVPFAVSAAVTVKVWVP